MRLGTFSAGVVCLLGAAAVHGDSRNAGALPPVRGGFIVVLGCGEGRLVESLAQGNRFVVQGLEADPAKVAVARERLWKAGLYGRVTVEEWRQAGLPYVDNLVNVLVVQCRGNVPGSELMRVLCPGGTVFTRGEQGWIRRKKPWPPSLDEWTHYLHDSGNNAVAEDTVVGPPEHYQWIAPPLWARSHDHLSSLSALVSAGGRLFSILDEGPVATVALPSRWRLVARDAFSGVLLWTRKVGPWEGRLRGFRSGPPELARRLVAVGDRVYVTLGYGKPLSILDAATGATLTTCPGTDNALELVVHAGRVFVVVGNRPPANTGGAATPVDTARTWLWWPVYQERPPQKHLVAVQATTGALLWKKDDADTTELLPTTLAASGEKVFFENQNEVLCLDARTGRVAWRASRPVSRSRPSWSAPTLVVHKGVVLSADRDAASVVRSVPSAGHHGVWVVSSAGGHAPPGKIMAFAADTGQKLWESTAREGYNSPVDVLIANDRVWTGNQVSRRDPGITRALDLNTGAVCFQRRRDQTFFRIGMAHHRCYRDKATVKYLILGRDGIEFIDVRTGRGQSNPWVRGACQYGVLPCNGLIYAPAHSCACHIEAKLNSFNALAPAEPSRSSLGYGTRLERGAAYARGALRSGETGMPGDGNRPLPSPQAATEWPTYRHDNLRSGRCPTTVRCPLTPCWQTRLPGRLTSPVVAEGRLFVAGVDEHTLFALDAATGKHLWRFIAGGRIDSPPTVYTGTVLFGAADGRIYRLTADTGELVWSFRAAPHDRWIMAYNQVESAWPAPGSVLVQDGNVYAVVGRTAYLDGGMVLCRLDAASGRRLSETRLTKAALPDILSCDGDSLYLRHRRFSKEGALLPTVPPPLYSPAGFRDGSWWHRTYWLAGATMQSGWGAWPNAGNRVPAGRLLVLGEDTVYGFGRLNEYDRNGSHVGLGTMRYYLFAAPKVSPAEAKRHRRGGKRKRGTGAKVNTRWAKAIPLLVRGMVLAGKTLFVAGPPDVLAYPTGGNVRPYDPAAPESLQAEADALTGKRGGVLWAVSAADGKKLGELLLPSPPAWDGLIAAEGCLFLSTLDGRVWCFRSAETPGSPNAAANKGT